MEHPEGEKRGWVHFLMKRLGDQQPFHKSVYGSLVFLGFHKTQFLNIPIEWRCMERGSSFCNWVKLRNKHKLHQMEYQYKTAQTFHSYIPCDLASTLPLQFMIFQFNFNGENCDALFWNSPRQRCIHSSWLENFHCYFYTRRRRREKIETLKYFDISSFCSKHAGMWE